MVGTKAMRSPSRRQRRTCSRTAAIVVTVSKRRYRSSLEAVLGGGVFARFHRAHVALNRIEVVARPFHEVAYEARLAARGDVEHVVGDEDLAIGIGTCAD